MVVKEHKLAFGKGKATATVQYGSCWHVGNPNCRHDAIKHFIAKAKRRPWWHVGDMIESIMPGDPRFSVAEHAQATTNNVAVASEYVADAADTCIGVTIGNHEWKASAKMGDLSELICNNARVPYLGGVAYITWRCPDGECVMFTAHGRGSMRFNSGVPERDQINSQVKLRRSLDRWQADLKCVGHFHRTIVCPGSTLASGRVQNGQFVRDAVDTGEPWCVACPSTFGNYEDGTSTSYAEIMLLPPTDMGWIEVDLCRDGSVACVREIGEDGMAVSETERQAIR